MSKLFAAVLVLSFCAFAAGARGQSADRVPQSFDPAPSAVLQGHHPQWAVEANDVGAIDPNKGFDNVTLTLARSPEEQKAFDQLVEDQRNPKSPQFHHWLTPIEIGAQYGVSDHDIAQVSGWLESQGLHVNLVSPTRTFISFGGTASSLERAFGAPLHNYKVAGEDRFSIVSDPMVPPALAPVILSIRGLSTAPERPQHISRLQQMAKPDIYLGAGDNIVGPADFAKIYDLPTSETGAGVTIGIVGEARVNSADITNFNTLLGTTMGTATEVVPTAYGGVDPGPALTSEPSCLTPTNTCSAAVNDYLDAQGEATLDETRSGSVAQGASILLVTATSNSGGITDDAEYLTETAGPPAQIMSISFGGCEADATGAVSGWSSLFEDAAAEGISVFVSSGDSGAAGCDTHGAAPPSTPGVASPNYLCSPAYETCVGGTEFNDASDYSTYWNSSNGTGYESAKGYIPEGAWNDPGTAPSSLEVGSSGGGVSSVIATPSWQTGTGVPSARAGRYTPDVAFTASADHEGYLVCMAAYGGACNNGYIEVFGGTSASAPDMAGIAALLDQAESAAQGNITPSFYAAAAAYPSAFHDVTVTSSGVSGCAVTTPSMCNNSIPGHTTLTGGTQGYLVQTGYDEVTGWGSLDVTAFIEAYEALSSISISTPTVTVTPTTNPITYTEALTVNVTVSGSNGTATGSVKLTSGSYTSSAATLSSGSASISVPGSSLPTGSDTLTVTYTPDTASSSIYNSASGTATETV
ncbi:MAG: protease pro-enzyme activation domain-containing protein, partial [Terracidiphilus sp.]